MAAKDIVKHQFKKGKSGNPKGKPKGSKSFKTILDQYLNRQITIKDPLLSADSKSKKKIKKKLKEIISLKLLAKALAGDRDSIRDVMDRMDGRPVQEHEVSGDLTINIGLKESKATKHANP